jgi:hypothetical protein
LEVIVALVGFFLALLVMRRPSVWSILECSPELIALLGGMVVPPNAMGTSLSACL